MEEMTVRRMVSDLQSEVNERNDQIQHNISVLREQEAHRQEKLATLMHELVNCNWLATARVSTRWSRKSLSCGLTATLKTGLPDMKLPWRIKNGYVPGSKRYSKSQKSKTGRGRLKIKK